MSCDACFGSFWFAVFPFASKCICSASSSHRHGGRLVGLAFPWWNRFPDALILPRVGTYTLLWPWDFCWPGRSNPDRFLPPFSVFAHSGWLLLSLSPKQSVVNKRMRTLWWILIFYKRLLKHSENIYLQKLIYFRRGGSPVQSIKYFCPLKPTTVAWLIFILWEK